MEEAPDDRYANAGLSESQRRFLSSVERHEDDGNPDDDGGNPPRFPIISTIIICVLFALTMAAVVYSVSYSSQYVGMLDDSTTRAMIDKSDLSGTMGTVSAVYNMRGAIYGAVALVFAMVEGVVLLLHWYHVRRWKRDHENDRDYYYDEDE